MDLKDDIMIAAKDIGIDMIGFTDSVSKDFFVPIYEDRKSKGCLVLLDSVDSKEWFSPKAHWDLCKSVVSIGVPYRWEEECELGGTQGLFARVSRGVDYHKVLHEKIKQMMERVKKYHPDIDYKAYVDNGPVSDRAFAWAAGVGFYGKNGFIISPDYGSFVFLGQVLLNKELSEKSTPLESMCGHCDLCINACPVDALKGPFRFDGNKCISYLTQKKGILNRQERKAIGQSLYGCDICQDVCPFNKEAKLSKEGKFKADCKDIAPELEYILNMDNKTYSEYFKGTSSGWRGKRTLQRNAVILCGNILLENNFTLLLQCIHDQREEIRIHAMFSLLEYGARGEKTVEEHIQAESCDFMDKFNRYR
ncbi:tRNA epoxyqueuosine(34) reductase QueG [Alkalibacter saccharofermentans]|uniref:Epoxyqueuosine reductase n=1 Tax=Alkalibacter saccharofermentans DSM 14828 TaxID=1120975 RepID=A0A1M4V2S0_9FIRM|nr:tRNA epoxyqueuosine(34) reductase QueG [Alkalibacter saccharofermentans]SHE63200.1 epoxyqueuosine reductase [Alkalibacter saccharofermentans DSM 14828]